MTTETLTTEQPVAVGDFLTAYRDATAGRSTEPQHVAELRERAVARFEDRGFPTVREEEWRHTNVAPISRERFGDALYHIEFSPSVHDDSVTGQGRGNSGVYLMGQYELQILDSYGLEPGMGDCGACYGVALPLVTPYRPAGEWSTYDIEFTAPRFDEDGNKTANARITAWLNGRKIHDDLEVPGPTAASWRSDEFPMGPLKLQDHGNPVRFRNAWVLPR